MKGEPTSSRLQVGSDTNERFVLCHLTPGKCEQWGIDIGFGPEEEVSLVAAEGSPPACSCKFPRCAAPPRCCCRL